MGIAGMASGGAAIAAGAVLAGIGSFEMFEASSRHRVDGEDAFTAGVGGRFVAGLGALGLGTVFATNGVTSLVRSHGAIAGTCATAAALGVMSLGAAIGASHD